MGNRKLPFGYQMRMGEIIRNEPETKAVQDIFLQYTFGASLKEIAEQMSKTGPTYDEGKSWNKNMVSRILENAKYTGTDDYPRLIDTALFESAASAPSRPPRRSSSRSCICSADWQSDRSALRSQKNRLRRCTVAHKLNWMIF